MTIELAKDLEQIVHDAVRSGTYAREDDVIRDALTRLSQAMPDALKRPVGPASVDSRPAEANAIRRMMDAGLITQQPDTAADIDDPADQPIAIQGEPLSETVIRHRR